MTAAGYDVAVIECDMNTRFLSTADQLAIPVIFGNVSFPQTLEAARVYQAHVVAALTSDDIQNRPSCNAETPGGSRCQPARVASARTAGAGGRFRSETALSGSAKCKYKPTTHSMGCKCSSWQRKLISLRSPGKLR
ncbi:NAD-binding protein [Mycobacterium lepromatosis]|uniref:NAD-binding protein n=1 Tax=Mycobacterium lepromatosis TaxID=480418 RepID=UPI003B502BC5